MKLVMKILKKHNKDNIRSFNADEKHLPELLDYIKESFSFKILNRHIIYEYQLLIEEVAVKLIKNAAKDSLITVEASPSPDEINLKLTCPGKRVNLYKEDADDIGGTLIEDYSDYLKQSFSSGTNRIVFSASSASAGLLMKSISAFVASAVIAFILRLVLKDEQVEFISNEIITPIIYVFLGIFKAVASPMVFFSIASMINKLSLKFEKNKSIISSIIRYLITATVSAIIGFAIIGVANHFDEIGDYTMYIVDENRLSDITVSSFISQFIFESIIDPIEASNPIPMLVLAVILGIASSSIYGRNGDAIRNGVSAFKALFRKMFDIVYSTIPLFLTFTMIAYWAEDPIMTILSLLDAFVVFIPGAVLLILVYAIELLIHHINPISFVKEYKEILINNLKIGSDIEAYPYNKRAFSKKFKNREEVKELLQLGETVSMDGCVMVSAAYALYLVYSVHLDPTPGIIISLLWIILMSSIGSPSEPGSLILTGIVVMNYLGLSDAVVFGLIIYEVILGVFYSYMNNVSDIVNIVCKNTKAKKKNLLNI